MKNLNSMGLRVESNRLMVLDQRLLPNEEKWVHCTSTDQMIDLIKTLATRGAPLIGVAAALALAQLIESGADRETILTAARKLREARPTAVNLMAAMDRMIALVERNNHTRAEAVHLAERIFEEDVELCEAMAERGALLVQQGDHILTHCNAGALATAGIGTAVGVIRKAHEQGKNIHVYVDETRPLLQGARLTAWELQKLGIPYTLICDNMAAFLMSQGKVNRIFVGSDRIAANGDFANKIGTYSLAVLAHHHKVPMYAVAPITTVDFSCPTGAEIPIEERNPEEVRAGRSPKDCKVWNPAFDVTPRHLVAGVILNDRMM